MNMNPSQTDILAAELLRLQKVRGGQQHPAAGGGALGSGGVPSSDPFRGGLDFPSVPSLGSRGGLLASDFALSQSLASHHGAGATGVHGAHCLGGDARTRPPPIPTNNSAHHMGLPPASHPGYLRSSVDLSSNRGFDGCSPFMANSQSQLAAKSLMSDRFAGTHSSAMQQFLAVNRLSPEEIQLLLASQSQMGSAVDFRTAGCTGNMIFPSLLPPNGATQPAAQDDPGWEEQYKALREYHQQFGHCKVSHTRRRARFSERCTLTRAAPARRCRRGTSPTPSSGGGS